MALRACTGSSVAIVVVAASLNQWGGIALPKAAFVCLVIR